MRRHNTTSPCHVCGRHRLSQQHNSLPQHTSHRTKSTHLDVLLRILQIFKEGILSPHDTTFLIGARIRIPVGQSRLTAEKPVEVGSLLVGSARFDGMALRALGLEDLGSLLLVTWLGHCCSMVSGERGGGMVYR